MSAGIPRPAAAPLGWAGLDGSREVVAGRDGPHAFAAVPGSGGAPRATRTFRMARAAPRAARRFVTATLRRWGGRWADRTLIADAAIVAAELAANAIVHARSGFTIAVARLRDLVRISVRDAVRLPGGRAGRYLEAVPSHGLGVVAAVSARWGAEPTAGGKLIWADLAVPEHATPA